MLSQKLFGAANLRNYLLIHKVFNNFDYLYYMKINHVIIAATALLAAICPQTISAQPATRQSWNKGWTLTKDGASVSVDLPHDWGVDGPFVQDYPGETGKLAWWGKAEYSKTLVVESASDLPSNGNPGKKFLLDIDGAMSNAKVYCNGKFAGEWPYGYASFEVDLTPFLHKGDNDVKVALDNPQESSRWYPGGGIYRNVWLTISEPVGIDHWGVSLTTDVSLRWKDTRAADAFVNLDIKLRNEVGRIGGRIRTEVFEADGTDCLAFIETNLSNMEGTVRQRMEINDVKLWAPEHPEMYLAVTTVTAGKYKETFYTHFGIRASEFKADGYYLNGKKTFLKGVCLHHDAGALGAVWNESAWIRRLTMLKNMGCNAIRTSHNPPAPEFLSLCDKMGFLVMDELTDTWSIPKKPNGYAKIFDGWVEKDLKAMIHRDRNHPSVIMWSIGNEVPEQGYPEKYHIAYHLTEICHTEDPTRPTIAGCDNPWASEQDWRNTVDVYGFNYKPHLYAKFHEANPGKPYLGTETASTISSRGVYLLPPSDKQEESESNFQVSSFDLYTVRWGQTPEQEWKLEDENPECAGEFVWTGYDYLGEPTPYNFDMTVLTNFHTPEEKAWAEKQLAEKGKIATPSRSSYFGIIDLAGFPKDRYWLYQARWAPEEPVLHILPHWNWEGHEGQVVPIHVYTNLDKAELFINGKSKGARTRAEGEYRLRWDDVVYEPGTVKVVGYKDDVTFESVVETASKPRKIRLEQEEVYGDLRFIDVAITDSKGRVVPTADNHLKFSISGPGQLVAVDAGDPTCHTPFHSREIDAFNGLCSAIVRPTGKGTIILTVESAGLKRTTLKIYSE